MFVRNRSFTTSTGFLIALLVFLVTVRPTLAAASAPDSVLEWMRTAESTLLLELADTRETLKTRQKERSHFLAQWKIFEPRTAELTVLCEYWEAETHYWRKKCWWQSDKKARERDREVVRAAVEAATMEGVAIAFSD